jgi:hypothetical protein
MTCVPCRLLGQFFLNCLNLLDHAGNCLSLGDADETISARVARARRDGGKWWAVRVCAFLTTATRWVTFGRVSRDHCAYALDKTVRPNTREIFSLTRMRFNWPPMSEVEVIEVEDRAGHRYTLIRHRSPSGSMPTHEQALKVLQDHITH